MATVVFIILRLQVFRNTRGFDELRNIIRKFLSFSRGILSQVTRLEQRRAQTKIFDGVSYLTPARGITVNYVV